MGRDFSSILTTDSRGGLDCVCERLVVGTTDQILCSKGAEVRSTLLIASRRQVYLIEVSAEERF